MSGEKTHSCAKLEETHFLLYHAHAQVDACLARFEIRAGTRLVHTQSIFMFISTYQDSWNKCSTHDHFPRHAYALWFQLILQQSLGMKYPKFGRGMTSHLKESRPKKAIR